METIERAGTAADDAESRADRAGLAALPTAAAGRATTADVPVGPSARSLKQRLVAADAVAVAVGLILAFAWQSLVRSEQDLGVQRNHLVLAACTFPIWMVALGANKLYQSRAIERPAEELRRILNAALVSIGAILGVAFVGQFKVLSRLWVISVLLLVVTCLVIERAIARRVFVRMRRERPHQPARSLIVGTDADAIGLLHATQRRPELGYQRRRVRRPGRHRPARRLLAPRRPRRRRGHARRRPARPAS